MQVDAYAVIAWLESGFRGEETVKVPTLNCLRMLQRISDVSNR